jgi:hypothetical protein
MNSFIQIERVRVNKSYTMYIHIYIPLNSLLMFDMIVTVLSLYFHWFMLYYYTHVIIELSACGDIHI